MLRKIRTIKCSVLLGDLGVLYGPRGADDHGVYSARGIHGQAIYVDPKAEMVIARFALHPLAANVNLDPLSLPAYRAIAEHLMKKPR